MSRDTSRRAIVTAAALAAFALVSPARADTSYFSFQGSFSTSSGAFEDINFTLPVVAGNNPLTLRTYAAVGGTNAAGQAISSGGIDSILTLFNASNVQLAQNDDIVPGNRDSLISPAAGSGATIPNEPGSTYRVRLTNFSTTIGDGHWAADIINAATGVNTTVTATAGSNSSLTSLALGATGTANATFALSGGSVALANTLTISSGGILNHSAGTLAVSGNISLPGGTYNNSNAGNFTWAAGKTLSITAGGHFDFINSYLTPTNAVINLSGAGSRLKAAGGFGGFFVDNGAVVNATAGAQLVSDFFSVGASTNVGGSVSLNASSLSALGTFSGINNNIATGTATAGLTLTNASTAVFANPVKIADSGTASGSISLYTASTLTAGDISIATNASNGPFAGGNLFITDPGSSATQTGAATLTIGGAAGFGSLTVQSGASFTSGTGATLVNPTGRITVNSGTYHANGELTLNQGLLNIFSGTFLSSSPVNDNGQLNITTGGHLTCSLLNVGTTGSNGTLTVDGAGSSLTATSAAVAGFNGFTGTYTFTNAATGAFPAGLFLAYSSYSSTGILNVQSGSQVTIGSYFEVGNGNNFGPVGSATVTGAGSSISLSPSAALYLGDIYGNPASLTVANNASFTVGAGGSTTMTSGSLNINAGTVDLKSFNYAGGTINFTAGSLSFIANLTVGSTGFLGTNLTLSSNQTLTVTGNTTVDPSRTLTLAGGTLNTSTLTNNGELQILDPTSSLTGGTLTNNNLLDGDGHIANNLTNSSAGEVRASNSQHLTFTGTTNSNAGKINMVNGGIVEFTSALTNSATGVITGRGAFYSSSLTNNGQIQLSGGPSDLYGPITTNSGGKIITTGAATATFHNPLTMNAGSEFNVSAGSSAVFLAPVVGAGSFTGTGAKFFQAGASSPTLIASGGSTTVQAPASLTVDYLRESSLTSYGTTVTRPNSAPTVLNSLTLNSGGTLDLSNNKLILDLATPADTAPNLAQLRSYLLASTLFSSTANADPQHRLTIAYADNALLGATTWGGLPVDSTSILTKLTYFGDANLDGRVNADDYALLDKGFAKGLATWVFGDFNYDGAVTSADYLLIDRVYLQQSGTLPSPDFLTQRESQFGSEYVSQLLTTIPEPSSLFACVFAKFLFPRRRR